MNGHQIGRFPPACLSITIVWFHCGVQGCPPIGCLWPCTGKPVSRGSRQDVPLTKEDSMETSTASCRLNFNDLWIKRFPRSTKSCYRVNQNKRTYLRQTVFEIKHALEYFPPVAGQKRPLFPTGIATAPRGRGKAKERERERPTGGAPAAPTERLGGMRPPARRLVQRKTGPFAFTPLYAAPPLPSSCFAPGLWSMAHYQLLLSQAMLGRSRDCTTTATKQYTLWEELWSSVTVVAWNSWRASRIRARPPLSTRFSNH